MKDINNMINSSALMKMKNFVTNRWGIYILSQHP